MDTASLREGAFCESGWKFNNCDARKILSEIRSAFSSLGLWSPYQRWCKFPCKSLWEMNWCFGGVAWGVGKGWGVGKVRFCSRPRMPLSGLLHRFNICCRRIMLQFLSSWKSMPHETKIHNSRGHAVLRQTHPVEHGSNQSKSLHISPTRQAKQEPRRPWREASWNGESCSSWTVINTGMTVGSSPYLSRMPHGRPASWIAYA